MRRTLGIVGIIIISPEMLAILLLTILYFAVPQVFIWLAFRVSTTDEQLKFLALAPLALTGIIINKRNDLLFPEHKESQLLQEWPDYHLIYDRYWVCLLFSATCTGVSLVIWLIGLSLKDPAYLVVFLTSLIIPIITFFTFINATISLKRLLFLYKQKHQNGVRQSL